MLIETINSLAQIYKRGRPHSSYFNFMDSPFVEVGIEVYVSIGGGRERGVGPEKVDELVFVLKAKASGNLLDGVGGHAQ